MSRVDTKTARAVLAASALLALAAGCSESLVAVTVTPLTSPPLEVLVEDERIEIYEGNGVGLELAAYTEDPNQTEACGGEDVSCDGRPDPIDPAEVFVEEDDGAIDLRRVDDGVYILVGLQPGDGTLIVTSSEAGGAIEIPVTVLAQP